jgi:hypothetical protein
MPGLQANPLYGIRASRARPPGLADEGERRAVYGTALTQFEELMAAAEMASAQTRPLSLFYALSQAGRSIAAAHLPEEWRLKGHGLRAIGIDSPDLTDVEVGPVSGKALDSFAGVAAATGSETLAGPVGLVELWASLPGVSQLIPEEGKGHRMPLGVVLLGDPMSNLHDFRWITAGVAPLLGGEAEEALTGYRHGRTAELRSVQGLRPLRSLTAHGEGVEVRWPNPDQDYLGEQRALESVAPTDPVIGDNWLRPELSDGSSPSDLVIWWAVLYTLSMLARYQPATWSSALDYDDSVWVAALGELLRAGVEIVPALVLYGSPEVDAAPSESV